MQIECSQSFPSLTTLVKLAEVFQCKLSEFFEFTEHKDEKILKNELKTLIDNDYENCKRIYSVIKNFIDI